MVVFLDTSVLAKRYVSEFGSEEVDAYYIADNQIVLAPITPIEIRSVFNRRLQEKSLSDSAVKAALSEWNKERTQYLYQIFDDNLVKTAIEMISKFSLKSLDSIQLASASLFGIEEFVTADKALAKAAESILDVKTSLIHKNLY